MPAVFEGWRLGQETGAAVADTLFGDYNPSGKLPVTVPRSVGQLPDYYYQKPTAKRGYLFTSKEPLFVFGHGLSYTTYKYSNLRVTPERTGPAGQTTVTVDVTNAGYQMETQTRPEFTSANGLSALARCRSCL